MIVQKFSSGLASGDWKDQFLIAILFLNLCMHFFGVDIFSYVTHSVLNHSFSKSWNCSKLQGVKLRILFSKGRFVISNNIFAHANTTFENLSWLFLILSRLSTVSEILILKRFPTLEILIISNVNDFQVEVVEVFIHFKKKNDVL